MTSRGRDEVESHQGRRCDELPLLENAGRRSLLARMVVFGGACLAAALAGMVGFVAAPRPARDARRWRRVAAARDVREDEPLTTIVGILHTDGWYQTRRETVVFIDREADGFRALSAVCTHLGCRVGWSPDIRRFQCPCHRGVYERDGQVVSGPPPRPLARLDVRVNTETSEIEVRI